ncbi:MAG: c-type cytochrome [Pirellulales bacterium]|nr:c-type cytochrome [Pirellulales bacterium]
MPAQRTMSNFHENLSHEEADGKIMMPAPTAWPIVLAAGTTLLMLGLATSIAFTFVGGVLFLVALLGWISQLLPGRGHELEELASPAERPTAIAPRVGAVEQLKPGVVGYRFQLPEKVHPVTAGFKGGIVGGAIMPIPAIVWSWLSGHGIWFPVNLLAGMVLPGLDEGSSQQVLEHLQRFLPGPFFIAIVIHVAMSIGIGLIYGVILPTLPPLPGGPLVLGGIVLPALWTAASHSLMGVVNPLLHNYVNWLWFVVSQFIYGVAASLVIMRSEKIPIRPRGPGRDQDAPSPPPGWLGCLALILVGLAGCNDNFPGKPVRANEFAMPSKITDFQELYSQRCAACHGADGTLGAGPPLNDPLFMALVGDEELQDVISHGRKGTLMPAWSQSAGGPLTNRQIASLVEGIKGRKWSGEWTSAAKVVSPNTPPLLAADSPNGSVDRGKKVFATACATCHGESGEGVEDDAGAINNHAFLTLVSDALLRRIIITGRPDLQMPDFADGSGRESDFKPLTAGDVNDLMALLNHWRMTRNGK